jgi:hypothetical protein
MHVTGALHWHAVALLCGSEAPDFKLDCSYNWQWRHVTY